MTDTYIRGTWGTDDAYDDEDVKWTGKSQQFLTFPGFDEEPPEILLGNEHSLHLRIYFSVNPEEKYPFFAVFSTGNIENWYLIPDFPSVLMFIREVSPVIEAHQRQEQHEILLEDHAWKAKNFDPSIYRSHCTHI